MALPDYEKAELGTAVVWGEDGGAGVTATLALDALADGSARMGDAVDLGDQWDELQVVILELETGTAPAAGAAAQLYMACSPDGSIWPGGVTGTDGAWPADGSEDEWAAQLGTPVVTLIATNDANTLQRQAAVLWRPSGPHVAPVVDNNLGQALRDQATASNNLSRVRMYPYRRLLQDTA